MSQTLSDQDLANLSDDEIMNMAIPPAVEPEEIQEEEPVIEETQKTAEEASSGEATSEGPVEDPDEDEEEEEPEDAPADDEGEEDTSSLDDSDEEIEAGKKPQQKKTNESDKTPDAKTTEPGDKAAESTKTVDYEAEYKKIMAPFVANGRKIQMDNSEDVIRLLQMGANYTKKIQAMQPALKLVKMLENNGLAEEGKLSFLIDVSKKNPAAIQKLLKEGGIDPLDIDTNSDSTYTPTNHTVSDEQMRFSSALEDVKQSPAGKGMIVSIHQTWDKQSKDALWEDPNILRILVAQKENGIFDRISHEIERRKMLGQIGDEPFINSYHKVGDEMNRAGLLTVGAQPQAQPRQQVTPPQPKVLERRVAQTTKKTANDDRAKAAGVNRGVSERVMKEFNPLSLSDEDFEKAEALNRRL